MSSTPSRTVCPPNYFLSSENTCLADIYCLTSTGWAPSSSLGYSYVPNHASPAPIVTTNFIRGSPVPSTKVPLQPSNVCYSPTADCVMVAGCPPAGKKWVPSSHSDPQSPGIVPVNNINNMTNPQYVCEVQPSSSSSSSGRHTRWKE
jgi:hypothetical protein